MGLLDRIGAFDRYKVSPTQGTSGLLTGAQQPMSPFAQQAARSIGGALGIDMRTPSEVATQAMSQIGQDDPERLRKIVEIQLQAAVRAGDTTNAAKYANVLENIKAQEADKAKLATPKVVGGETEQLKDEEGNRYARVMKVDTLGNPSFELIPLGGAPKVPVGTPQTIGSAGLTSEERIAEAGDQAAEIKKAEAWADQVNNIYGAGFLAVEEIPKLEKVLEIVEDPNFNSGVLASVLEDFQEFFGLGSADVGEFKAYTAEILTQKLDAFTGAISEGERKYLERNLATFERGPEVNARLLRNILEGFEKAKEKALVFADREDSDNPFKRTEWLRFVNNNRFVGANDNGVREPATKEATLDDLLK